MGEVYIVIAVAVGLILVVPVTFGMGYAMVRGVTWIIDSRWVSLALLLVMFGISFLFLFGGVVPVSVAVLVMIFGLGAVYGSGMSLVLGGRSSEREGE